MTTLEQAKEIARTLSGKKGINIQVIKIDDVSILADYIVIATGTSSTHVKALADDVEYRLKEIGFTVSHVEGYRSNTWILLDYIDIIVHVFSDESRKYYDLERLWKDGTKIDVSDVVKD